MSNTQKKKLHHNVKNSNISAGKDGGISCQAQDRQEEPGF